jgi:DNA-directed RNA polymerase subunit beta'
LIQEIQRILKEDKLLVQENLEMRTHALKRKDMKLVEASDAVPATSSQVLQGITKAALQTKSFM